MKKYILFFITIVTILGIVFIYTAVNTQKSKDVVFTEAGYILNGSQDKYYFNQDDKYSTTYDDKIAFVNTDGKKVTLDSENFIHYESGNIVTLQDSVLLDLSKISENPIIYYNVGKGKEIKKLSNRYVVKNLNTDMPFEQGIWKISANKYIILGKNLKIILDNGTIKDVKDYVEIEYFDNEIVNIYNQEINYQTISSNTFVELENGIKVNLGTKIVSQDDENKMSLENMVINSDDNITIIDLNEYQNEKKQEDDEENEEEEEIIQDETITLPGNPDGTGTVATANSKETSITGENTTSTTSSTTEKSTTNNENKTTIIDEDTTEEETNTISFQPAEIEYEIVSETDSVVNKAVTLAEPTAKLENMEISPVGVSGQIQITDENDLLSKQHPIIISIINDSTGKTVYQTSEGYGTFSIPLKVETLIPETEYSIIISGTFVLDEKEYSKNFLNKTFVTSPVGVQINKNYYTDSSLSFNISITDENISNVTVSLLDSNGEQIPNRNQVVRNSGNEIQVEFEELEANTEYTARISKITYLDVIQEGENWVFDYNAKTLKQKSSIDRLNYSIDKREGFFNLIIEETTDPDDSIQNYQFVVYKFAETEDGSGVYRI